MKDNRINYDLERKLRRYAIGNLHLCGSESEQIKEGGYDTLSTYGIMKDVRQTYVREIIDHLELQGLLSVSDDYHTLEITPDGDEFIRSRRTLLMKRSKRAADISAVTQFSNSDGVEDPELMKRLRELRKKFADTLGAPAFVVFSDAQGYVREKARHKAGVPVYLRRGQRQGGTLREGLRQSGVRVP